MAASVHATARSIQSNSIDRTLPTGKPKPARLDLNCQSATTPVNLDQAGDSTLALIDETFVLLGWKHSYVATLVGIDPALFSRAMSEKDRKAFDARWFSKFPAEFWVAFHSLIAKKFSITHASRQELLLEAICGHLDSLKTLVQRTAVSE